MLSRRRWWRWDQKASKGPCYLARVSICTTLWLVLSFLGTLREIYSFKMRKGYTPYAIPCPLRAYTLANHVHTTHNAPHMHVCTHTCKQKVAGNLGIVLIKGGTVCFVSPHFLGALPGNKKVVSCLNNSNMERV